ncbi:MAG: class I SAM-dependent methyltransferase [Myxococcales bacterium]|nr:class I SAM-dependent methyltransferase [Myxococcales bacterium]
MWDQRYDVEEYVYGKEPNDFLRQHSHLLPEGEILCLAEGEGRNAVYLAEQGYHVTAIDASAIGLSKAHKLALERNVSITTQVADLEQYKFAEERWSGIVSIFAHLPPLLRKRVHQNIVHSLRPGGVFLLEAYTPAQLQYKTGGPPVAEMMMDLQSLQEELVGLQFIHAQEIVREVHEGQFHHGTSAVVQIIARRD